MYTEFLWVNLRETDHLEDPYIDGRIILRWISRKWDGDGSPESGMGVMDWIDLAQDRDRWQAPVNAVMNLRVL